MGEGGCKPDEGSTSIIYALSFVGHVCPNLQFKNRVGEESTTYNFNRENITFIHITIITYQLP